MSKHIQDVQERLVVTLYGSTLPELFHLAAAQFEERRRLGLGGLIALNYEQDDQGHWLMLVVAKERVQ